MTGTAKGDNLDDKTNLVGIYDSGQTTKVWAEDHNDLAATSNFLFNALGSGSLSGTAGEALMGDGNNFISRVIVPADISGFDAQAISAVETEPTLILQGDVTISGSVFNPVNNKGYNTGVGNALRWWHNGTNNFITSLSHPLFINGQEIATGKVTITTGGQIILQDSGAEADQPLIVTDMTARTHLIGAVDGADDMEAQIYGTLVLNSGTASGTTVNEFSTDGGLVDNSDDAVPTEKAVKTYVDGNAVALRKTVLLFHNIRNQTGWAWNSTDEFWSSGNDDTIDVSHLYFYISENTSIIGFRGNVQVLWISGGAVQGQLEVKLQYIEDGGTWTDVTGGTTTVLTASITTGSDIVPIADYTITPTLAWATNRRWRYRIEKSNIGVGVSAVDAFIYNAWIDHE